MQFEAAYKRLIIHTELTVSFAGANCVDLDLTPILSVSSTSLIKPKTQFLDMLCSEEDTNDNGDLETLYMNDIKINFDKTFSDFNLNKIDMCITGII